MFDVSFSEIVVIAVVALVVIGPEKLPKVARTLGALAGRMQRYVAQVKEEVNREVRFQELQQLQQEIQETVTQTKEAVESSMQGGIDAASKEIAEFESEVNNPKSSEQHSISESPASVKSVDTKPKVKRTRSKKIPTTE